MAKITKNDVMHLASLSKLSLSDSEAESLQSELEVILKYVAQLSELNTEGVDPTYQVNGLSSVWRKDELGQQTVQPETLLALAPEQDNKQIKIPKVL
jgi:aspartyl-tRNA(Asn)/glutamyl-tRNA(Gln) amidotransferase subunit C